MNSNLKITSKGLPRLVVNKFRGFFKFEIKVHMHEDLTDG